MNSDRLRCAEAALRHVPEDYRTIGAGDLVAQENGHHFHRGMHIGWVWGDNGRGGFLDLLSEHRMAGMHAERYFPDGTSEAIETPAEFRAVDSDPLKDAELQRAYFERNQAAYQSLRARGLLPPAGTNVGSQDINEFLQSGGDA